MKYSMTIDPNKWTKISETEMENETPYWCKMTDGRIVMSAPYSNGYCSGMAQCFIDEEGLKVETNKFYILRNCFVQPVIITE